MLNIVPPHPRDTRRLRQRCSLQDSDVFSREAGREVAAHVTPNADGALEIQRPTDIHIVRSATTYLVPAVVVVVSSHPLAFSHYSFGAAEVSVLRRKEPEDACAPSVDRCPFV